MSNIISANCPYCGIENRLIINDLTGGMVIRCGAVFFDDRITQYDKHYKADNKRVGCGAHFYVEWSPNVKVKRIEGEGKKENEGKEEKE